MRAITYQETREVTAVGGAFIKLKVTGKTANDQDFTRVDEYAGPGALRFGAPCADEAYRFPTPLQRVAFPVAPGQQIVEVGRRDRGARRQQGTDQLLLPHAELGQADRAGRNVRRHPRRRDMVLDDSTPFRDATNCNFTYWYSPAVRATVREHRWAQYMQIGDIQAEMPVLNIYYELASFTPGK